MALATYSDLRASIADWLNRADLGTVIPDFIRLAEARFNRELRTADMVKVATAQVNDGFFAVPSDYLETIAMRVTDPTNYRGKMDFVSIAEFNRLNSTPSVNGVSRYYTIIDGNFRIAPAAGAGSPVSLELTYYAKIAPLSDSVSTNWLLTKSPDLYLYTSLMQAAPYLKDDERVAIWATGMGQIMEAMKLEADRATHPSGKLVATRRTFG